MVWHLDIIVNMYNNIQDNMEHTIKQNDVSFKINGIQYHLHKSILSAESGFFKALFENEQYMGIKDDEIKIYDVYDKMEIGDEVIENTLYWLYDNCDGLKIIIESIKKDADPRNNIIEMLKYCTVSDFFLIDNLKMKCADQLKIIVSEIYPSLPNKWVSDRWWNLQYIKNQIIYRDRITSSNIEYCNDELGEICNRIYYIKKYGPKYFHNIINKYVKDNDILIRLLSKDDSFGEILKRHICDENKFCFKIVDGDKLCMAVDELYLCDGRKEFYDFICGLHEQLYNLFPTKPYMNPYVTSSLYWIMDNEDTKLPIEYIGLLMDALPNDDNPIRLLSTKNWQDNNGLNWNNIFEFRNLCIEHGRSDCFKAKLRSYLEICYL